MSRFYKTGWVTPAPYTFAPDPVRPWEREGLVEVEAWPAPTTATSSTKENWSWWQDPTTTTSNPLETAAAAAEVLLDVEIEGDLEWWAWALIGVGAVLALAGLAGLVPFLRQFG